MCGSDGNVVKSKRTAELEKETPEGRTDSIRRLYCKNFPKKATLNSTLIYKVLRRFAGGNRFAASRLRIRRNSFSDHNVRITHEIAAPLGSSSALHKTKRKITSAFNGIIIGGDKFRRTSTKTGAFNSLENGSSRVEI